MQNTKLQKEMAETRATTFAMLASAYSYDKKREWTEFAVAKAVVTIGSEAVTSLVFLESSSC